MPSRKIVKNKSSEIESEAILKIYIYSYRDNSYISCTYIIATHLIYNYFNQHHYWVTFTDPNDPMTH